MACIAAGSALAAETGLPGGATRPPVVAAFERFGRSADDERGTIEAGLVLVGELGCTNCHAAAAGMAAHLLPKQGPNLEQVAVRLDSQWIISYLRDPHTAQPGTTMPHLLAALESADREHLATSIGHFLASQGSVDPEPFRTDGGGNAAEGAAVHDRIGCAACHGPAREPEAALSDQRPLHNLAAKWRPHGLDAFLRDPLVVRPAGRMPAVALSDDERRHLVTWLAGAPATVGTLRDVVAFAGRAWHAATDTLANFDFTVLPLKTGPVTGLDAIAFAGRSENVVVCLDGFLHVPTAGTHRFLLGSDDGSRLFIGDRLVVDVDGNHGHMERQGEIDLPPGTHPLRIEYFQGSGGSSLDAQVAGPDGRRLPLVAVVTPAADGTPYVLTEAGRALVKPAFAVEAARVTEGRAAFAAVGCASCHRLTDPGGAGPVASTLKAPPLAALARFDAGCLSSGPPPRGVPHYGLDAAQRQAIAAAIRWLAAPPAPSRAHSIDRSLLALNCLACHVRDGRGGNLLAVPTTDEDGEPVTKDERRDRLFTASDKELGDEGRLPPTLTNVGDKLAPAFLRTVLVEGGSDRRLYMNTRMPKWHAEAAEPLAARLADDARTTVDVPTLAGHSGQEVVDVGRLLAGSKALGCIKCHSFAGDRGQSMGLVAMTRMPVRLRHDWFLAYVADPQRFRPGTRMPAAWPAGKSFYPDLLDGTASGQIEAVWRYLATPGARAPLGTSTTSLELVPVDRPIIYRNFIENAGPRAIGVGYPEGVNIAWDAEALRLALVWRNAFIDASRHWSGRGEGWQPPLGDGVFTPDAASAMEVLPARDAPWPAQPARSRGARFKGYALDADGRPTFSWTQAGLQVRETLVPAVVSRQAADAKGTGGMVVRRTLRLEGKPASGEVVFRAARATKLEDAGDGWTRVDGGWKVRVSGAGPAIRYEHEGCTELRYLPTWPEEGAVTIVEELAW
jgi:mono/diheme cytochrome c family protein